MNQFRNQFSRRDALRWAACAGGVGALSAWNPLGQLVIADAAGNTVPTTSPSGRPNIVFILADDLGYGDVGVFYQNSRGAGKPSFSTPNLDAMARQGMMMRSHYSASPVCAPARASLLTGTDQGHCAVRDNQFDAPIPAGLTLASVVKEAGYHTAAIGKWGLGGKEADGFPAHPLRRGFDEFFGFMEHVSGHTYYHDAKHPLRENFNNVTQSYEDIYSTDLFTARAKKFLVERSRDKDVPFFLYLAYTAVHNKLEVPGEPYPSGGGLNGGMQWPLKPTPGTRDQWIHPDYAADGPRAAETAHWNDAMRRYATMARRLDDGVGDFLATLRDLGIDRNTLVVFSSDNGPANEGGGDPRFFDSWGPFDGFKRDCWEGGIREPTIAWWPGKIAAGTVEDRPSAFWDWMPTFADLAGLAPPAHSDGVSLLPTLLKQGQQRDRGFLYTEYFVDQNSQPASKDVFRRKHVTGRGQQQVVRIGDFVGVRVQIKHPDDPLRLYNVVTDPHEDHNLADDPKYAPLLQRMTSLLVTARRPDPKVKRPYDNVPMPAVAVANLKPGQLRYASFAGHWPWMPDLDAMTPDKQGYTHGLDLSARPSVDQFAISFVGYIDVPATDNYTFYLNADNGAHLWIHDAHVFDSDFPLNGEISEQVLLSQGLHPIRIYYRHVTANQRPPVLGVDWSGPSGGRRGIGDICLAE